ncbi:MAG TPA: hypothetical protein VEL76_09585 [Gemmataceae bacterium]|nr:hypothetical protein [Gemmataceae bacterium]
MVLVGALLLFLVIAAITWAVAIALYQSWVGGPDVRQHPDFVGASLFAVGLVTLASTIPFPGGYLVSLGIWWLAAKSFLQLPTPRAVALFLVLAALSFLSRLAVLGALAF